MVSRIMIVYQYSMNGRVSKLTITTLLISIFSNVMKTTCNMEVPILVLQFSYVLVLVDLFII